MTAAVHTPAAPSDIAGLHLHLTTLIEQLSELEMSANHPPRRNARALLAEAQDAYDQAADAIVAELES